MWWIVVLAIVLALFALIFLVPVFLRLDADSASLRICVKYLFLSIPLFPDKPGKKTAKKKTEKKKKTKETKEKTVEKKEKEPKDIIGILEDIKDILRVLLDKLRKALRIRLRRLHICVGTEEAAKTALLYSAVCASYDELSHFLKEKMNYREKNNAVIISLDFNAEKTTADIRISIGMNVVQLLSVAVPTLLQYMNSKNLKG